MHDVVKLMRTRDEVALIATLDLIAGLSNNAQARKVMGNFDLLSQVR